MQQVKKEEEKEKEEKEEEEKEEKEEEEKGLSLKERQAAYKSQPSATLSWAALDHIREAEEVDPSCMSRKDMKRYYKEQNRQRY